MNSKEITARAELKRRGYSFDWISIPNGTECHLYDEDGSGVAYWSQTGNVVLPIDREEIEGQIALEHLEETQEVRS